MFASDVPLASLTTLGVGGPAARYVEAGTDARLGEALAWAREASVPVTLLAGGSNVVVADRGLAGLVVRVATRGVCFAPPREGRVRVEVAAGESLDALVALAVERGLAGLECLSGVPGSVGATPVQNVGAYGQEVASTLVAVEALARATGEAVRFDASACGFGYRSSAFKGAWRDAYVVTRVTFDLVEGGAPDVRYPELARALGARPTLAEARDAVLALRRGKSMLFDPADANGRSVGSFFVNPTLRADEADAVARRADLPAGESMPRYAAAGGFAKLSAGWLIERAGFPRGTSDGRVGLSTRHALAVVNRGGASAAEVVAFAARVRAGVRERFGVSLAVEPDLLGFEPGEVAGLRG